MRDDALRRRCEYQLARRIGITHGARAEAVDREQATRGLRVDHGDGERAQHLLETGGSVLPVGFRNGGSRTGTTPSRQ